LRLLCNSSADSITDNRSSCCIRPEMPPSLPSTASDDESYEQQNMPNVSSLRSRHRQAFYVVSMRFMFFNPTPLHATTLSSSSINATMC
jgi:hypothetical protein